MCILFACLLVCLFFLFALFESLGRCFITCPIMIGGWVGGLVDKTFFVQDLNLYALFAVQHFNVFALFDVQQLNMYALFDVQQLNMYALFDVQHLNVYSLVCSI